MAITSVQAIGTAILKATSSSLTISPVSKTATAGNDIFIEVTSSTSTATGSYSATDNLGNTYSEIASANGPADPSPVGIRLALLKGHITTGGSITSISITLAASGTAHTAMAHEFSGLSSPPVGTAGTVGASSGNENANAYPGGPAGTGIAETVGNLWVGGMGWKISGTNFFLPDSVTGSVGVASATWVQTTGGSTGSNNGSCLAYFICDSAGTTSQLEGRISSFVSVLAAGAEYAPTTSAATYLVPLHRQGPNFRR